MFPPFFRYDPRLKAQGKNPFQLDSQAPSIPLEDYMYNESRFTSLRNSHPEEARKLLQEAQEDVQNRRCIYETWAKMHPAKSEESSQ